MYTDHKDLLDLAPTLMETPNGRRALLYLLTPSSTRHILPSNLKSLASSAQQSRESGTSKKDPILRRKEIVVYASPGLLDLVAKHGEEWTSDSGKSLVVLDIMLHSEGGKRPPRTSLHILT